MAKSNNQKGKILYLEKMMRETGENRVITMQEILAQLLEHGIHAERKSIYDDIEVLRSFGMDITYRRGRPGGYYLAGQAQPEAVLAGRPPQVRTDVRSEGDVAETEKTPDRHSWKTKKTPVSSGKQMKLKCSDKIRPEVETYFGSEARYNQKEPGVFTVTAELLEGAAFYGWLLSQGKEIQILKPKKAAQNYRDYLKSIARVYKGV